MNIPSLPTDSLYKFMAIFGLVILVAVSYFEIDLRGDLKEQTATFEFLVEKSKLDIEKIAYDSEVLSNKIDDKRVLDVRPCWELESMPEGSGYDEFYLKAIECIEYYQELEELRGEYREYVRSVELLLQNVQSSRDSLNLLESRLSTLTVVIRLFQVLGGVLIVCGFVLWYRRVQKYQDKILIYQEKKARNEYESLINSEDNLKN